MAGRDFLKLLLAGGPGFCQLAVTNACNARCRFCSFAAVPEPQKVMADPGRLLAGLVPLQRRGVRYLTITGGEPLLYPPLWALLTQARRLGLTTLLVTNGALLSPEVLRRLRQAGLGRLLISLDSADPQVHDAQRGLPGLAAHIRELVPWAAREGLHPTASVTLSRLTGEVKHLAVSLKNQGFVALTFSYPLTRLESSYLGYARHPLVDFSPLELGRLLDGLHSLLRRPPLPVLNTHWGLREVKRRLQGRSEGLSCLAGHKFFYIDWHLEVYRCHILGHRLGPLEQFHRFSPVRTPCRACVSECYLDASAYQHLAASLADALAAWRQGAVRACLTHLFQAGNLRSLEALWQGRRWLRGG